jgi:hypothetical protein
MKIIKFKAKHDAKKDLLNEMLMTTPQVAKATKYSIRSIYQKVGDGTFQEGVHYFRPSKRRLLFRRAAVVCWLKGIDPECLDIKA